MTKPTTGERTERRKLSATVSVAARRNWLKRLTQAQEDVEQAELKRNQLFAEAYEAGISYSAIEIASGLGPVTVRNLINAHTRGTEEDHEASS